MRVTLEIHNLAVGVRVKALGVYPPPPHVPVWLNSSQRKLLRRIQGKILGPIPNRKSMKLVSLGFVFLLEVTDLPGNYFKPQSKGAKYELEVTVSEETS